MRRDWRYVEAAVPKEKCWGCGKTFEELIAIGWTLDWAHLVPREHDAEDENGRRVTSGLIKVSPLRIATLCGPPTDTGTCHCLFRLSQARAPSDTAALRTREGRGVRAGAGHGAGAATLGAG